MNNLDKAKIIIKAFYEFADLGIYNSRNVAGDVLETIYNIKELEDGILENF